MSAKRNKLNAGALVAHPLLQHSHQMAWALFDRKMLLQYRNGIPTLSPDSTHLRRFARFFTRIKSTGVNSSKVHWNPIWPMLAKAARTIGTDAQRHDNIHRVLHAFDWYEAKNIEYLRPEVVIAYENSAYYSFQAAKKIGALCVLEAPSLHHKEASQLINIHSGGYINEINRRKDREVELADKIITCSPIAADSYIKHGVPSQKILSLLLGADLPAAARKKRRPGVPRFIFAGTMSERKSIDILFAVFKEINKHGVVAELIIFGGSESDNLLAIAKTTAGVSYNSQVGQQELYSKMAECDCLVLVSRFDSFGMVVAEAMAVGTPAIVSTMTGAKAIIENYPGSGWIVEPNFAAISHQIKRLVDEPHVLAEASPKAIAASRKYTWNAYRERAADAIGALLASSTS